MTTTETRALRADAVKNRQRILAAAEEVFAADGVMVPVDVVAARAGVGVGTLYRHFPTKEALFEAIVVTRLQELVDAAAAQADAGDATQAFFDFLRQFARVAASKHDLMDAFSEAGFDFETRCAGLFDALRAGTDLLRGRASDAGGVRQDVSTDDVIGLVVGACKISGQTGLEASPDRMLEVVLDGLRTRA